MHINILYTASKVKHHLYFCWNNFQSTVNLFYWTWKIFNYFETVNNCLNENLKIHVISEFCYNVMSIRDLSKLLAVTLRTSKRKPQHLKTNFAPISDKIVNIYSRKTKLQQKESVPFVLFAELTITYFSKIAWLFYYLIIIWCSYVYF